MSFYEVIEDITADAGIRVRAKGLEELFCKAILATFNEITDIEKVSKEFPSVWTNIHTYRRFKATRRGLRASMSPGSTLSPHNLSERLTNALRAYFFGGFLSFPTWDKNKYSTPRPVVKGKKLDVCLYKTTRSDTGFKDKKVELEVKGELPYLLADVINQLLVLHEKEKLVISHCERVEFKEDGVKLMLKGGLFDPERHPSKLVIKAATYHRLKVEKLEDGYLAEVIFDI